MSYWAEVLKANWGIHGALDALPGEFDLNFLVTGESGSSYVLKVMREGCDPGLVAMQCQALQHIAAQDPELCVPRVVPSLNGSLSVSVADQSGLSRPTWLITVIPGRLLCAIRPWTCELAVRVGASLAALDNALQGFTSDTLRRTVKWDMRRTGDFLPTVDLIHGDRHREIASRIIAEFGRTLLPRLNALPSTPIHNDANDNNVLVDSSSGPLGIGFIDFGDMILSPVVCEVAIAAAYMVLDHRRPIDILAALVGGYHRIRPLSDAEIDLIYPLVLVRLAVSVANSASMKITRPEDQYAVISEAPALRFLERSLSIPTEFVRARLRAECGYPAVHEERRTIDWLVKGDRPAAVVLGIDLKNVSVLDISVAGKNAPSNPLQFDMRDFTRRVEESADSVGVAIGRYGEPRLIYTHPSFRVAEHPSSDRRTIHLGLDIFAEAGTAIHTPYAGVVRHVGIAAEDLDYGGYVCVEHATAHGDPFFTFYGHLAREAAKRLSVGQSLRKGEQIGQLGTPSENGGWPPHLHLQLGLVDIATVGTWPGVADPDDWALWRRLFPNPAVLFGQPLHAFEAEIVETRQLRVERDRFFGSNVKLSYRDPITILRGFRHYLFDNYGRTYLDAYNNVPQVGHANPRITRVIEQQSRFLNTNTRYAHPLQTQYAEALLSKFSERLNVCYLLNSASEANELALRLAKAKTGANDVIVMEAGYHGNTNAAIDISEYKFNGPGGRGAPDWVRVVPLPDPFRGRIRSRNGSAGKAYARFVSEAVADIRKNGRAPAAFICETFPSVGGQIVLPDDYLTLAYEEVRRAGGICIADEVQTGLGRTGTHFWGYSTHNVEPDIVVLGKPLANGHPMAAVVTTRDIAASFANGMEFFSSFGGSTMSCAIGLEVLKITEDDGLQHNAYEVGSFLIEGLKDLASRHPLIGEVRGSGLFIGVELVEDSETLHPATRQTKYVVNRMREERILIGSDGAYDNVLKIRPPLTFAKSDAELLLGALGAVLRENACGK